MYCTQIDNYNKLYEFNPNKQYRYSKIPEEKMFCSFLEEYGWERFKDFDYNNGKNHIYVIFNYEKGVPMWVGFLHALECNKRSKECIQEKHFLKEELFRGRVVFIHTINIKRQFRHKGYGRYMVDIVKNNFSQYADLMVEATKKGKRFWPAVGFSKIQRTPKGIFMRYPKV